MSDAELLRLLQLWDDTDHFRSYPEVWREFKFHLLLHQWRTIYDIVSELDDFEVALWEAFSE